MLDSKEQNENDNDIEVGNASEFKDGDKKEIKVGKEESDAILVIKKEGKFYATGARCAHLGAKLEEGALIGDFISCPWHRSSFNIKSGVHDQGPTVNGIPVYPIREEKGKLIAKVPKEIKMRIPLAMSQKSAEDERRIVIIGSGPCAFSAAETLRQIYYQGEIIIVSKSTEFPYDRTLLSKETFDCELEVIQLRDEKYFKKHDITMMMGKEVKKIDAKEKSIEIDGEDKPLKYDKLLIATGSSPKKPEIDGVDLENVFLLRDVDNMYTIRKAVKKAKKVVILGAAFIGHEVAAAIKKEFKDKVEVTLVGKQEVPFEDNLGAKVGYIIKKIHEKNGLKFALGTTIETIEGDKKVSSVKLKNGKTIEADVVILGVGVKPNTDICKDVLEMDDEGGIKVDEYLKTSDDNIYAAGDVAKYPFWMIEDEVRIEHYSEAIQQGTVAAYNLLGQKIKHDRIPFFWTEFYDLKLHYIGNCEKFDDVHVEGELNSDKPEDSKFMAYYIKDDKVLAFSCMNTPPAPMVIDAAMRFKVMPSGSEVKKGDTTIDEIKKKVDEKSDCWTCRRTTVLSSVGQELF